MKAKRGWDVENNQQGHQTKERDKLDTKKEELEITDEKEIAETFNRFFKQKIEDLK